MNRGFVFGALIGAIVGALIVTALSNWLAGEVARIKENQALSCREGFVKLERLRQRPACVTGYEP